MKKAVIILKILRREREINEIAGENEIALNQVRSRKSVGTVPMIVDMVKIVTP